MTNVEPTSQAALSGLDGARAVPPVDADAEAVRATLSGNREAFEGIVTRHERAVYTLAYRMTGHEEDARDVAQEAFLRAYRSLAKYDARRPFRPWLLRITANAATDHLRSRGRATLVSLDGDPALADSLPHAAPTHPAELHEADQRRTLLRRAVALLRGGDAELFHLHYGEELSVEQIATHTGRRANTIAVALHRLRERLHELVHRHPEKDRTP